jgi:hypothetical protein
MSQFEQDHGAQTRHKMIWHKSVAAFALGIERTTTNQLEPYYDQISQIAISCLVQPCVFLVWRSTGAIRFQSERIQLWR